MKDLLRQIPYNIRSNLLPLPLDTQPYKLSHRMRQILLIIQQLYNLLYVLTLHILHRITILLHTSLQQIEYKLLIISRLSRLLIILQQRKPRLKNSLRKILIYPPLRPKHMHLPLQHTLRQQLQPILTSQRYRINLYLLLLLILRPILLSHLLPPLHQHIPLLQLRIILQKPGNQINISL